MNLTDQSQPAHEQLSELAQVLTAEGITCFIAEERKYSGKGNGEIERNIDVMLPISGWVSCGTLREPHWPVPGTSMQRWWFKPSKTISYVVLAPVVRLLAKLGVWIDEGVESGG